MLFILHNRDFCGTVNLSLSGTVGSKFGEINQINLTKFYCEGVTRS